MVVPGGWGLVACPVFWAGEVAGEIPDKLE